jgi:hypothetical protein
VRFKATKREQLAANLAANKMYAAASTKPLSPDALALLEPLPAAKERAAPRDLEGPVMRAVGDLLRVHPAVILALRVNSGMAYSAGNAPVWFHKWIKPRDGMRMPDYIGLTMRHTVRPDWENWHIFFAIECKEPNWKGPRTIHEKEQDNFLLAVRTVGGKAGFATSVDMAQRIIEGD